MWDDDDAFRSLSAQYLEREDFDVVTAPGPAAALDRLDDGFYVEDDGPGIPESKRDAVLKSGYLGGDGAGIRLAIVDAVADSHGWPIRITGGEDGGVRFKFHVDDR